MATDFKPFSDQQLSCGEIDIDSAFDKIVLKGELTVDRSVEGLALLQKMVKILKKTEEFLLNLQEEDLLDEKNIIIPPTEKDNPFD